MQLNFAAREVTIKLVYYGPALSGKTTNLKALHELTSEESHGRLMTLQGLLSAIPGIVIREW